MVVLLLSAQAVTQLLSSLQACLVSLGGPGGGNLDINFEAADHLLQASVLSFQSAQPFLQVLHQTCQLPICRTEVLAAKDCTRSYYKQRMLLEADMSLS